MDAIKLWTTFQNKRKGRVVITDPEGTAICTVEPGGTKRICSWDPFFLFARFSRVLYLPGGKVAVDEASDWKNPWAAEGRHTLELLNLTKPDQIIIIDGRPLTALCGIPTLVELSEDSPLIEFEKLTWKVVTRKFPCEDDPRYVEKVTRVEQIREPRGRKEMRAIRKEIQLVEEAKVKAAIDHRFPSVKGPTDETA